MSTSFVGRSVRDRVGASLGAVTDVVSAPDGVDIEWLRVRQGRIGSGDGHLVPARLVRESDAVLICDVDAAFVWASPAVAGDLTPTRAERQALLDHYENVIEAAGVPQDPVLVEAAPSETPRRRLTSLLVLLNEQVCPGLLEEIDRLSAGQPAHLHVLVPEVSPSVDELEFIRIEGLEESEPPGQVLAGMRARLAADRLRASGHSVHTEVVGSDPVQAVEHHVAQGWHFDGLVVATPHAGPSRWFHRDLPSRLSRSCSLPTVGVVIDDHAVDLQPAGQR